MIISFELLFPISDKNKLRVNLSLFLIYIDLINKANAPASVWAGAFDRTVAASDSHGFEPLLDHVVVQVSRDREDSDFSGRIPILVARRLVRD